MEEFFTEQLTQIPWLKTVDPEAQLIGVGGSFRNICRISKIMRKYPVRMIHNYVVHDVDFTHTYNLLKSLDLDKKKKIRGISSGRADILPSALAAINAFKKYMNLGNIVISASGVRTGLMFNYADYGRARLLAEHADAVFQLQQGAYRSGGQSLRAALQAASRAP